MVLKREITSAKDIGTVCDEQWKTDLPLDEGYVAITMKKAGVFLAHEKLASGLDLTGLENLVDAKKDAVDLHFVPYWARANRGGKCMMRVGIRTLD